MLDNEVCMEGRPPNEGAYSAGEHLYVEPFVILGHQYRAHCKPLQLGDYAVIRSHSVIYADVVIGHHFKCGHGVIIRAETQIGNYCVLGGQTIVEGDATIGDGTRIMSGVYIPTRSQVGNFVFIGPGTTFLNDKYPMRQRSLPIGPTLEDHACIGGGAVLGPGVRVGTRSFVASGCVVHKDVPPNTLAFGVPGQFKPLPRHLDTDNIQEMVADPQDLWYPEICKEWDL
jgi:acetyltransferase-like isoleucine patch superfamily enzyme